MSQLSNTRDSFFLWTPFGPRKWFKIKTWNLWSVLPLKGWDSRTDLLRSLVWRRKAALNSDCLLKLQYRKLSLSTRWVTAMTAVRTQVSLHCPTSSNLFRERKQGMGHFSHLHQQLQFCVLFLLAKATLCGMKSSTATQGRMTEVGIFAFSSGFLLHLKPVLPASTEKD